MRKKKRNVWKRIFFFIFLVGLRIDIYFDWREGKTTSKCSTNLKQNNQKNKIKKGKKNPPSWFNFIPIHFDWCNRKLRFLKRV